MPHRNPTPEERKRKASMVLPSPKHKGEGLTDRTIDVLTTAGLPVGPEARDVAEARGLIAPQPAMPENQAVNQTATLQRETTAGQPSTPQPATPTAPVAPAGPGRPAAATVPTAPAPAPPPVDKKKEQAGFAYTTDPTTGKPALTYNGVALPPDVAAQAQAALEKSLGKGITGRAITPTVSQGLERVLGPETMKKVKEVEFKRKVEQEAATKGLDQEAAQLSTITTDALQKKHPGVDFSTSPFDTRLKLLTIDELVDASIAGGWPEEATIAALQRHAELSGTQLDPQAFAAKAPKLAAALIDAGTVADTGKAVPKADLTGLQAALDEFDKKLASGELIAATIDTAAEAAQSLATLRQFTVATSALERVEGFTIDAQAVNVTPDIQEGKPGYKEAKQQAREIEALLLRRAVIQSAASALQKDLEELQPKLARSERNRQIIASSQNVQEVMKAMDEEGLLKVELDKARDKREGLSLALSFVSSDMGLAFVAASPELRKTLEGYGLDLSMLDRAAPSQADAVGAVVEVFGGVFEALELAQRNPTEFKRLALPLMLQLRMSPQQIINLLNTESQRARPGSLHASPTTTTTSRR